MNVMIRIPSLRQRYSSFGTTFQNSLCGLWVKYQNSPQKQGCIWLVSEPLSTVDDFSSIPSTALSCSPFLGQCNLGGSFHFAGICWTTSEVQQFSRWWQLKYFFFSPPKWGNDEIWRSYFSNGLVETTNEFFWFLKKNTTVVRTLSR